MANFSLADILFILLVGGIVLGLLQIVSLLRQPRNPSESAGERDRSEEQGPKA